MHLTQASLKAESNHDLRPEASKRNRMPVPRDRLICLRLENGRQKIRQGRWWHIAVETPEQQIILPSGGLPSCAQDVDMGHKPARGRAAV